MINRNMDIIERRQQQLLCDKKWHQLNRKTWIFRHIPFVEFAFGSGSLAIGNVDNESDFDVLIGARTGRIFTARFCAAIAFGLFGWRRSKMDHRESAANKMCLNHFVTPASYRLRLPANSYWALLYQRLVPVYGPAQKIQNFFDENRALIGGARISSSDQRWRWHDKSMLKRAIETLLELRFGDWIEEKLKQYQVKRIERGLPSEEGLRRAHRMHIVGAAHAEKIKLSPLIVYSDEELEFHPDPAVIEMTV